MIVWKASVYDTNISSPKPLDIVDLHTMEGCVF